MKTLTLLAMMCLAFVSGSNAAVLWETGFETPDYSMGELVPQNSWEYFGTYFSGNDVTNVNAYAGTQCVRLYNNGAGDLNYSMARKTVDVSSVDITNSYVRFSTMIWPNTKYDGFRIYDSAWSQQILLAVRDTGVSLGSKTLTANYTSWNELSLTFDVLQQKVIEFSVNDDIAPIDVAAPFVPSGIRLSAQFAAPWPEGLGYTNTFFDNVKVETTPSFRITPDKTSLAFITPSPAPQTLTLTPDLTGLSYDVTVSSTAAWESCVPSTFTITDSPVDVTVSIDTTGLTLPTSVPLDVVSSDGVRKQLTVNVRSSLIAYDGYDYPLSVSVTNLNGGSGWDAPWLQRAGTGFTDESIVVAGLTYSTSNAVLKTEGNAAYLIPAENAGYNYSRVLATSLAGDNKTVWISFLIQPKLTAWATCDLFFNPNWGGDQGAYGCQWNPNFRFVNGSATTVPGTLDETFFVVVRYDMSGANDTAWMWINPELQAEPNTIDADATQTKDMPLGDGVDWIINHNHTGTSRGAIIFDELRIGDNWSDVARLLYLNREH